jgi:serine/threonine protein kinase
MAPLPGERVCGYEIAEALEPQAVGALYRTGPGALLLVVDPALLPDEAARKQVVRKVKLARGLRVHGLAQLVEVHADGEAVALVVDDEGGECLRARHGGRAHTPAEAWAILQPIAVAVAALHAEGEVVGDLRGETVRLAGDGTVQLMAHGLGLALPRDRFLAAMQRTGQLATVAPEVQAGRTAGVCADVFSLGALGWELVHGAPPSVDGARADDTPVGRVLERALRADLRERPLNVQTFCRELEEAVAAMPAPDPAPDPDGGFGDAPATREFNAKELLDQHGQETRTINLNRLEELKALSKKG